MNNIIIKRMSNIELLKVIAVFMIVLSHSTPHYAIFLESTLVASIPDGFASANIQNIALNIFKYFGQLGDCVFIVCSAYFLIDSKSLKTNKIFNIIFDTWILSWIALFIFYFLNVDISVKDIIKSIFPLTFSNNWFIGCYILVYFMHPFLNIIISKMNKRTLLIVNIVGLLYFSFYGMFYTSLFYNDLVGFILIYFIVAYVKKYLNDFSSNSKKNILLCIIMSLCLIFLILLTNYLGLHIGFFADKVIYWNKFSNPLVIAIAITLFNLFKNINVNCAFVNELSSLSLFVYVIHENLLVRRYIKPVFWGFIYSKYTYEQVVMWVFILAILSFLISIIIALLYKHTLKKVISKISVYVIEKVQCISNKIIDRLMLIK